MTSMRSSSGLGNVQRIRRGDEHHLGQVEIDLEVMIVEGVVLLGIEHFEQRRRRIAAEVHRHLVDLIEHEQADCACRPWTCSARCGPASNRCRCGDDRGFRLRRARRRATCARTCDSSRAQSTGRAKSCRRPEVRPGTGSAPFIFFTRCCTARYSTMRSLTFSRPK